MIDTAAIRHNLSRVRDLAPGCRVLAVIKANGYGHGLVTAAEALAGADALAVARLGEGLALREAGCSSRIVLLQGVRDAGELEAAARHGFEPFVHDAAQIRLLEAFRGPQILRVWLKIDSGMHRLGFPPADVPAVAARLAACPAVAQPVALATHLASSERGGAPETAEQLRVFAAATAGLPGERSIANSAALVAWPDSRADWVRPGILLFGVSPFPGKTGAELGLRPAMSLETEIIALRDVAAGERVGYGGAWTAPRDSRIAVAAVGYGDGYPRSASNGTPVMVAGQPAAVAGRPSMDLLTIDVTGLAGVSVGTQVELWGRNQPVERVAEAAGTIPYELTCHVGRRVTFATLDA